MAAGDGVAPSRASSKDAGLLLSDPAEAAEFRVLSFEFRVHGWDREDAEPEKLVEPEVVATSPNRIKSPVPVCCGFDSEEGRGRWGDGVLE